jgi:hypothetical protein
MIRQSGLEFRKKWYLKGLGVFNILGFRNSSLDGARGGGARGGGARAGALARERPALELARERPALELGRERPALELGRERPRAGAPYCPLPLPPLSPEGVGCRPATRTTKSTGGASAWAHGGPTSQHWLFHCRTSSFVGASKIKSCIVGEVHHIE